MRVNKPFSRWEGGSCLGTHVRIKDFKIKKKIKRKKKEIQRIKEDLGDYLEDPEKYIRAFKGVTLLYDLTWKDMMYIL